MGLSTLNTLDNSNHTRAHQLLLLRDFIDSKCSTASAQLGARAARTAGGRSSATSSFEGRRTGRQNATPTIAFVSKVPRKLRCCLD